MLVKVIHWFKGKNIASMIVYGLLAITVITLVFVLIPVKSPYVKTSVTKNQEQVVLERNYIKEEQTITASGTGAIANTFTVGSNEKINSLIENYYEALAAGNEERLAKYTDNVEGMSYEYRRIFSEYVEQVNEIDCYTMNGLLPNTFIVVAISNLSYKGYETQLPNVDKFYVCMDASGNYYVSNKEPADDVDAYNEMMYKNAAMAEIISKYARIYDEKLKENQELADFVSGFRQDIEPYNDEVDNGSTN